MDGQLAGQVVPAAGGPDGVHVPQDVGDGHVRGGEFLHVAPLAGEEGDGGGVPLGRDPLAAGPADRGVGVVVDLAPLHHRDLLVQQSHQAPQDPAFRLPAQPQQDQMVPPEEGVDQLGDHAVVVADDAGEERLTRLQAGQEVLAQLVPHGAGAEMRIVVGTPAEFAQGPGALGSLRHVSSARPLPRGRSVSCSLVRGTTIVKGRWCSGPPRFLLNCPPGAGRLGTSGNRRENGGGDDQRGHEDRARH